MLKYIRFKNFGFVIFEKTQKHSDVVKLIDDEILSGGFVGVPLEEDVERLACFGEAQSIHKSVQEGDSLAIRRRFVT